MTTLLNVNISKTDSSHFFFVHCYETINEGNYIVFSINTEGYKIITGSNNFLTFYKDETSYYIKLTRGREFLIELKGQIINAQSIGTFDVSTLTQLTERA